MDSEPIFIVGCPRSGTTLLRLLIDSHSEIAIAPESSFLFRMKKVLSLYGDVNDNWRVLLDDLLKINRVKNWFPSSQKESVIEELESREEVGFDDILDSIYSAYARSRDKRVWGDKTPKNLHYIGLIKDIFPDSRFIILTRDGRDVALSLKKADFGNIEVYTSAKSWKRYIEKGKDYLEKYPEDTFEIKYEDLIKDPEKILREIFEFLNLEYEEEILERYRMHKDDVDHTKSEYYGKSINKDNYNKWKEQLSDREIAIFESIAGKQLFMNGYELSDTHDDINMVRVNIMVIIDTVKRFLTTRYKRNYINFLKIISARAASFLIPKI